LAITFENTGSYLCATWDVSVDDCTLEEFLAVLRKYSEDSAAICRYYDADHALTCQQLGAGC
jgi:hypothetical protein